MSRIRLTSSFACLLALLAFVPSALAVTVFHVKKHNPTPGDGLSWATAFKHPNDALAAADTTAGPVEIWVSTATYIPAQGTTDQTRSFVLSGDLELLGGFNGTETDKIQRDPVANPTILSGDIGLNDPFAVTDNSYHVLTAVNLSGPAVVDGFRILRGNALQPGSDGLGGGGLLIEAADVTVRNSVFQYHFAGGPFPAFREDGAAIFVHQSGSLTLESCNLRDNEAYSGAGLTVQSDSGNVDVTILDSSFERGRSGSSGLGAGILLNRGALQVERTLFQANRALKGAALTAVLASRVTLRDCDFDRNVGEGQVAAVFLDRADNAGATAAEIHQSRFFDNRTTTAFGGALQATSTLVDVADCEFRRNSNVRVSPVTGDLEGIGTVSVSGRAGNRFHNCVFADNFAGSVAGLVLRSAPSLITNTTFANNHSASADSVGVGLATSVDGGVELRNLIFWGNRFGTGENDDQPGTGGSTAQFTVAQNSSLVIATSDVEGWMGGASDQVFGAPPLFVNEALEDYRLMGGSPAIDAGDNGAVPPNAPFDLDGQPRIMDGLSNSGGRVDLGPYEFAGVVVATDPSPLASTLALSLHRSQGLVDVEYSIPQNASTSLTVFDLRGRRVARLFGGRQSEGTHRLSWDGRDNSGRSVAAGVYLVQLRSNSAAISQKVVLFR